MVQETGREVAIERLAAVIDECRKCPLWENTHHAVPGEGDAGAAGGLCVLAARFVAGLWVSEYHSRARSVRCEMGWICY